MAAITAFPDILAAGEGAYAVDVTYQAYGTISRGQVVQIVSAGVVQPVPATGGAFPVGVALEDAVAGQTVPVRTSGIAVVANSDASTAIAAGVPVGVAGYAGAVAAEPATYAVGYTIDAISGGSTGRIMVAPRKV